ncbi:MAG: aminopeptidase [Candidatus Beckwithbacteria bacterium]|nr:aminopeptidase [Patescibacteria group bacterium]
MSSKINPFTNVIQNCMAVKPTDSVLIVTDPTRNLLACEFLKAAKEITKKAELISFDSMIENAQEPPKEIGDLLHTSDVCLLITTYSLSHTQARKNACKAGARIASMPGITKDMILRTLSEDYSEIAKTSQKLKKVLETGKKVTITSPGGTNLTLTITNRPVIADTGFFTKPGDFGNLPAGETFLAPIEEKTNGTIIFDGSFAGITLDKPIKIEVKNGLAIKISGGKAAKTLKKLIDRVRPCHKAKIIGELGLGTNKTCKLCPQILEAEKVYGTAHLALGNNFGFGGSNQVSFHSDGIILNPTVTVDKKIIIKNNKILI